MTTTIAATDPQALPWALEALQRGALIAIPTDTVYGLAARLDRPRALRRLYEAKGRPVDRAIPILIADLDQLPALTRELPDGVLELARQFWPGPLTIVLPRGARVPDLIASGDTVGLRMPDHPFTLALLAGAGGALAVTSANRSGEPNLADPAAVAGALAGQVELVLDSGRAPGGQASTVLALTPAGPTILREGPVAAATLRAAWDTIQATSAQRG